MTLWRTAAALRKPRGAILIVDLLRPPDHETVVRLVNEHAKDAPPVLQRDFIASLHAAYTLDEVRQQLKAAGLTNFEVRMSTNCISSHGERAAFRRYRALRMISEIRFAASESRGPGTSK